jgi:hypothetical protein
MATINTTLYVAQDEDRVNPARLPAPNQAGGGVQMAVVPYVLAGTEATNDTINLCVLPAGAIPIPGLSFVDCSAATATGEGAAFVLDIGYASNPDALADGIALTAGGHVLVTSGTMPADALAPAKLGSGDTTLVATVASAVGTVAAAAKVVFHLAYKVPA